MTLFNQLIMSPDIPLRISDSGVDVLTSMPHERRFDADLVSLPITEKHATYLGDEGYGTVETITFSRTYSAVPMASLFFSVDGVNLVGVFPFRQSDYRYFLVSANPVTGRSCQMYVTWYADRVEFYQVRDGNDVSLIQCMAYVVIYDFIAEA